MPATKRGVYHNLKESKYTVSNSEIVLFFSSKFYMHKFLAEFPDNREKIFRHFAKYVDSGFHLSFNLSLFADIQTYKEIEKRGFRAWIKGVDVDCQELDRYGLAKMTRQNTLDWYVIQKPKLDERLKIME